MTPVTRAATSMASVPIRYRRGASVDLVAARTVRAVAARGERDPSAARRRRARTRSRARSRGQRVGDVEVRADGERTSRRVPLVDRRRRPGGRLRAADQDWFTRPLR